MSLAKKISEHMKAHLFFLQNGCLSFDTTNAYIKVKDVETIVKELLDEAAASIMGDCPTGLSCDCCHHLLDENHCKIREVFSVGEAE